MARLDEVFEIRPGHSLTLNTLRKTAPERGIPFVSRTTNANGISAYVERLPDIEPNPGGGLTCALNGDGGVMATFLQDRPFYTAFHIACLTPKTHLSTGELLYYCRCLWENHYRYGWGRQANRTLGSVEIPAPSELPSWINRVNLDGCVGASQSLTSNAVELSRTARWRRYTIEELFDIRKGKRLTKAHMDSGTVPYIGAIDKNNGVSAFVSKAIHDGNTISVNYDGSIGEAFYQPSPFWCSDAVNVLYPKFRLTVAIALFIATVIRVERYRFSYGRKWHLERMRSSVIRLPVTMAGEPDWQYMEEYISSLPFSSQLRA